MRRLYATIEKGTRHRGLIVLHADPAKGRSFPDWSMCFYRPASARLVIGHFLTEDVLVALLIVPRRPGDDCHGAGALAKNQEGRSRRQHLTSSRHDHDAPC